MLGNEVELEKEMETWPLWQCLKDEQPCRQNNWQGNLGKSLVGLIQLQWKLFGTRLDLLSDRYRDIEDTEQIDKLMREKPHYEGRVWRGG